MLIYQEIGENERTVWALLWLTYAENRAQRSVRFSIPDVGHVYEKPPRVIVIVRGWGGCEQNCQLEKIAKQKCDTKINVIPADFVIDLAVCLGQPSAGCVT
jgi:hypothetical protein